MEIDVRSLQEAIFEVVEIEQHIHLVHSGLRIAYGEVEVLPSKNLKARQLGNGAAQEFLFRLSILTSCLAGRTQSVEERARTKILLEIAQLVHRNRNNRRYRQPLRLEMPCKGDEGVVLLIRSTDNSYETPSFVRGKTYILTVASRAR